jgi:glutamine cyclotransferase
LYESTGQDESWIGIVDISTGTADRKVVLDKKYFGEGIAILNSKVFQITWKNKAGFIYKIPSFEKIGEFTYTGEGWGLTTDGKNLIMSNGTDVISFLDTVSLKPVRTLSIKHQGEPVTNLNELEYADGFLYANVWQTDMIAQIDPVSGEVKGFIDLGILAQRARAVNPQIDVLNGIAWHPTTRTMLVTGKFWPFIFILKLKDQNQSPPNQ